MNSGARHCAALLLIAGCVRVEAACPPSALEELDMNVRRSYALQEHNLDLHFVRYVDGQRQVFAGPGGTQATEYIVLQPESVGVAEAVCIEQGFSNAGPGTYTLAALETRTSWATRLSTAGRDWSRGTSQDRSRAIAIYEELAVDDSVPPAIRGQALIAAMRAHTLRSRYDNVLALAESRHSEIPATVPAYQVDWLRGSSQLLQLRHEDAMANLKLALDGLKAWEEHNGRQASKDRAGILIDLAEAHLTSFRIEEGERLLQDALILIGEDHRLSGLAYNNIGYAHLRRADLSTGEARRDSIKQSVRTHLIAGNFAESAGDSVTRTYVLSNIATQYRRVGNLHQTQRYFLEALSGLESRDVQIGTPYIYRNIGHTALRLGDNQRAIQYLQRAASEAETAAPRLALSAFCELAKARRNSGQLEAAVALFKRCANQATEQGSWRSAMESWMDLYEEYVVLGDIESAGTALAAAGRIRERAADPDLSARFFSFLPLQFVAEGKRVEAQTAIAAASRAIPDASRPDVRVDALAQVYKFYRLIQDDFAAMAAGEATLEEIERVYSALDVRQLGPAWSGRTHDYFVEYAEFLLESGLVREAFDVVERSRAISLRQSRFHAPEGAGIRGERLDLVSQLANTHAADNAVGPQSGLPLTYYQQLDLLALDGFLSGGEKAYVAAKSLPDIQAQLQPEQLVLSYLLGNNQAWLFHLTDSSVGVRSLGSRADLVRQLTALRSKLADKSETPSGSTLESVSRSLIPQDLITSEIRQLLIVPHKELHAFPFSALNVANDVTSYQPVIERMSLLTVPSLSIYAMDIPGKVRVHDTDLAVIADPVFGRSDDAGGSGVSLQSDEVRNWTDGLVRLPWTADESERITAALPGGRARTYIGPDANRDALFSQPVRNARILHVATHGYFDSDSPDNVGLALSASTGNGKPIPGFITLPDLFSMPFDNRLVVISGCDTAMGRSRSGEGMMGLSRGFLSQGVDHVVSTLWPVSDRASSEFMASFYEALFDKEDVVGALRFAQNQLRNNRRYRAPYFWAAYTLTSADADSSLSL